ncbi:MAG TPA: hypothetical protein VKZ81_14060 [Pseudonocardia sp.]|nr:hypothetical protein [Pseudonocardia sp.]HLU56578.1 hypothetical protein [Pseudonocardia sp.]
MRRAPTPGVYAQAACAVSRWAAGRDVGALLADLAAGGAFPAPR